MLSIDGSYGEGGGQVLRTALGLSCVLARPFHLYHIRRLRPRPGLRAQHLMCVEALRTLSRGSVTGDRRGSSELTFKPGPVIPGTYRFDIQTAGSTALLLQAILPAVVFSDAESRVTVCGGTHAAFSPTFDYFSTVFLPMLERLGVRVQADIESYGFYPGGGGRVTLRVRPAKKAGKLLALERGRLRRVTGISAVANLPLSIAERQRQAALAVLRSKELDAGIETRSVPSPVPGTYIFLKVEAENVTAGFSALGARGKRAETVGEEAARECLEYLQSEACLDPYLADQIVPYLAMADGESIFTTSRISGHLLTNLWVVDQFLQVRHSEKGPQGGPGRITVTAGHDR